MKLRKKPKYEIDAYHKMHDLRKESVNVLRILQKVYMREEIKKKIFMTDEMAFDNIYANSKSQKVDFDKLKTFSNMKVLAFHIEEEKPLHGPFNKQQTLKVEELPSGRGGKLRG